MKERKIGVLTSGGDAPGMNAAIRAVVRGALHFGMKVVGIKRGYDGLLSSDIMELNAKSVSDIIHRGGTILHTARCPEMHDAQEQDRAAKLCKILGIDSLVVIGGDGSFRGGLELSRRGVNVMGIPGTIDLDLPYTEYTIGFDTAVNTGVDAVNRIRDTSSAHERCSIVEVMGRHAGFIALWCGLAGGAEEVIVPERMDKENAIDDEEFTNSVIRQILENRSQGKNHNLIIMAEGVGGSAKLAQIIEDATGIATRATILGHLQRGGNPTAVDRMHASTMGFMVVEAIKNGERNKLAAFRDGRHMLMDIEEGLQMTHQYNDRMYQIIKALSV